MNVVLGIGNIQRGDDGAGPYFARTFRRGGWISFDTGTMPENFTSLIRMEHPERVVLVDAAEMGLPAGEVRRVPLERVTDVSIGTHAALTVFISYLASFVPEVIFIGIQPGYIGDCTILSPNVRRGIECLEHLMQAEEVERIPLLNE